MSTAADSSGQASTILLLRVFLPFASGYFLSYLYRTVNAVIAPDLIVSLDLDASDLGLLTSAYFLTFALFQLPLGILLDRFGPRRVEALLLLFAAAGALIFALSADRTGLILGRGLIGFGVAACLMASFKTFVLWFPLPHLPAVNGWIMAIGGIGALTATAPIEAILPLIHWRGLFIGLSIATLAVAAAVFWIVPEKPTSIRNTSQAAAWQGLRQVLSSGYFWRVAPLTTFSQAAFLSIQGLWAGPWLSDVAGLERDEVAFYLLMMASAMVAGFLSLGALAYRLGKIGVSTTTVASAGMACFMVIQLMLILDVPAVLPLWLGFGFFGTSGIVTYAALSQTFPPELTGRVNTALNLLVFITAFAGQWGIGAIIDQWPMLGDRYNPQGYRAAFGLVLALQALTLGWFVLARYLWSRGDAIQ